MPQAKHAYTTPKIALPKPLPPAARRSVEAAIEAHSAARDALIAFLDKVDGDPDLEPSLGGQECVGYIPSDGPGGPWFNQAGWASGGSADLEEQCEDDGAGEGM